MVKLNENQETALAHFKTVARKRHTLRDRLEEVYEKAKAELYADWEREMDYATTAVVDLEIPVRQIGLAYGSKDYSTAKGLVKKHYKASDAPASGTNLGKQHVVVTGTADQPLLTLNEWEVHADTPTVDGEPRNLSVEGFALRYREKTGMWLAVDTSDGVPLVLSRELMNRNSQLQSSIRTQVDALPEAE